MIRLFKELDPEQIAESADLAYEVNPDLTESADLAYEVNSDLTELLMLNLLDKPEP